jgi:polar amino acid transport system permease protein
LDLLIRYGPRLLQGLVLTLQIVSVSVVVGFLIAIPVAAARLSKNRIFGAIAFGYVYFFRGTPLLAQLFLVYYGAGEFRPQLEAVGLWTFLPRRVQLRGLHLHPEHCRLPGRDIPWSHTLDTKRANGKPPAPWAWAASRFCAGSIFPQAAMIALRPLGNEIILMIKGSAGRQHRDGLRSHGPDRRASIPARST